MALYGIADPRWSVRADVLLQNGLFGLGSRLDDTPALDDGEDTIYSGNSNLFLRSTGPLNLDLINLRSCAQAEVQAWVGRGRIAASTEHVATLSTSLGRHKHFRSDRVARTFRTAHQLQLQPVV